MMKVTIEMPAVSECMVNACAYNVDSNCHARAITIGDGVKPDCDTFLMESRHTRNDGHIAGVGACKVAGCQHNEEFECIADNIRVAQLAGHVNCMTYEMRA